MAGKEAALEAKVLEWEATAARAMEQVEAMREASAASEAALEEREAQLQRLQRELKEKALRARKLMEDKVCGGEEWGRGAGHYPAGHSHHCRMRKFSA